MEENDYNNIFEKLVTNDSPVGLIAYSLYKKQKREEIIKRKKNGHDLSVKEIKSIESVLSNQLGLFKEQANKLLDETFETLIKKNKNNIYSTYFKNQEFESIKEQIQLLSTKKTFGQRLAENLLFRFIWLGIIAAVSIIIYLNSEKLMDFGEKISSIFKSEEK